MLVPGEYLIMPPSQKPAQAPVLPTVRAAEQTKTAPVVEAKETESRSFLMILLRALGAIHT